MVAAVSNYESQSIMPAQGESERAFVARAHQALLPSIPNPDQRNQVVWNAWDQSNGNPLRDRARGMFTQDIYRHVQGVPYFVEHETIGRDGSAHIYGFNDLANIVDGQNHRADTDCYSAIASHHTSDLHKGPRFEPETVGYAGVYRLGMIGHNSPKWAVFADEFHKKDQADLFDKRRRRSVEVLRFKDGRAPILDPIATLGADSPRLNLPVARYEQENAIVERYSFVAPASVGANSSYVPKLENYEQAPPQNPAIPTNEGQGMLGPEDVQQIVTAMRSIPELAWVRQQMQTAVGGDGAGDDLSMGGDGTPDAAGASPSGPGGIPGGAPPMGQPQQPPQKMQQYGMGGASCPPSQQYGMGMQMPKPNNQQSYSNDEDDMVTTEQYTALQGSHDQLAERYASLSRSNERMMSEQQELREALVNLEKRAVDGERIQVISECCEQYKSTGVFDRDELLETCLYSNGSEMNPTAFDAHISSLTKVAERVTKQSPIALGMIPDGVSASEASEQERYNAVMDRHAQLNRNSKEREAIIEKYGAFNFDTIAESMVADGKLHR